MSGAVTNLDWLAALAAVAASEEMALRWAKLAEADVEVELGLEIGSVVGGAIICWSESIATKLVMKTVSVEIGMRSAVSEPQVVRYFVIVFENHTIDWDFSTFCELKLHGTSKGGG